MLLVSDIFTEVGEAIGGCDDATKYRAITRAVELLANTGLYDPQLRTIEFDVASGYRLALPRDCKAPIRINLDSAPSFARSRLFEFTPNTPGSVSGEEVGVQWRDDGRSPIQNLNTGLPSTLKYWGSSATDDGKAITLEGIDNNDLPVTETLVASSSAPVASTNTFKLITTAVREATTADCFLKTTAVTPVILARYQPADTLPDYRIIKLSKTDTTVRLLYRRHTFKLEAQTDIIPCDSAMAVIAMVRAVKLMWGGKFEEAGLIETAARAIMKEEQSTRDDGANLAQTIEIQSATNSTLRSLNQLQAGDVYDQASETFGPIGKEKLYDKITDTLTVLGNAAQWEWLCGWADVTKPDTSDEVTFTGHTGHGYFALPRFVGTVLEVIWCRKGLIPRNRWFEFHLNGTGRHARSDHGAWDELGTVCLIQELTRTAAELAYHSVTLKEGEVIPTYFYCHAEDALDDGKEVRVFGWYRDPDTGELRRAQHTDGTDGQVIPCDYGSPAPDFSLQPLVKVERITRDATTGPVRLYGAIWLTDSTADTAHQKLFGQWYPDEVEPQYQAIKLPSSKEKVIRIRYRRKQEKISSPYDPLHLKSKVAIENAMRALKLEEKDPMAAQQYWAIAINYLSQEQARNAPTSAQGHLQFDEASCPALTDNIY